MKIHLDASSKSVHERLSAGYGSRFREENLRRLMNDEKPLWMPKHDYMRNEDESCNICNSDSLDDGNHF